jgi:hypothetical protein
MVREDPHVAEFVCQHGLELIGAEQVQHGRFDAHLEHVAGLRRRLDRHEERIRLDNRHDHGVTDAEALTNLVDERLQTREGAVAPVSPVSPSPDEK